jgi:hypothetical protein
MIDSNYQGIECLHPHLRNPVLILTSATLLPKNNKKRLEDYNVIAFPRFFCNKTLIILEKNVRNNNQILNPNGS